MGFSLGSITSSFTDGLNAIGNFAGNVLGIGGSILLDVWNGVGYPIVEGVFNVLGFTDQDIYFTAVSSIKIVEDVPDNNLGLAVLRAVRRESDMVAEIQNVLLSGPLNSVNLYAQYGGTEYTYGLPTVVGGYRQIDTTELDAVLTTLEGAAITIITGSVGFPNNTTQVKYYLQENESYTEDDFEIFKSPDPIAWIYDGYTVDGSGNFDVDLQRTIADAGTHDGVVNSTFLRDLGGGWTVNEWAGSTILNTTDGSNAVVASNTSTTITATLSGGTDNDWDIGDSYSISRTETTTLGYLIAPLASDLYYNATYELDSAPGIFKYFLYLESLGTYPSLDGTDASSTATYTEANVLPIVPLRAEFISVNVPSYTGAHDTAATNVVLIDFSQAWTIDALIGATILNTTDGSKGIIISNTAISTTVTHLWGGTANIWNMGDTYLIRNIDPGYLTSKAILNIVNLDIDDLITQIEATEDGAGDSNIDVIRDAFVLFAINLYTESDVGKKALYLFFQDLYINQGVNQAAWDANDALNDPLNDIYVDPIYNTYRVTEQLYNSVLTFNYIAISTITGVIGPVGTYTITVTELANSPYDSETDTGGGVNSYALLKWQHNLTQHTQLKVHGLFNLVNVLTTTGEIRSNVVELTSGTTPDDIIAKSNFNIPLPQYIFIGGGFNYTESEILIYESLTIVIYAADHVHLEWYETSAFLNLVGFVITVIGIIVFVYSGDLSLYTIAYALLIQYALQLILTAVLIEFADDDLLKLLAILGYVAASSYFAPGNMGTAEALLFGVNSFTQAVTIELGLQNALLQDEVDAFLIDREERQDELDRLEALLDNNTGLDYWEVATYLPLDTYESPTNFYQRTIHTGNPGVLSLIQIENFHSNLLELPELDVHSFDPVSAYAA